MSTNNNKQILTILSKIIKCSLHIPLRVFYLFSFFIPRDRNIWIFGSWGGQRFADNSKYLFLHISNKDRQRIRPIWISKNWDIVRKIKEKGYESYHAYSLKGIYYSLKARYIFVDSSFNGVNFWCSRGTIKTQLWHGVPLKKIEHDFKYKYLKVFNANFLKRFIYKILAPYIYVKCDYVLTTSDFLVSIFASAFSVDKAKIIVMGYPRNDVLFKNIRGFNIGLDTLIYKKIIKTKSIYSNSKIISYFPTFRDTGDSPIDPNFDFNKLNEFLNSNNAYFILKLHPGEKIKIERDKLERIVFLPNDFDIYPILRYVDILITDYSSIYFDFLLLNRPIIFYPHDFKKYLSKDRELYFNYNEFTPGPKVFTFKELLYWIEYFIKGNDGFINQRRKITHFVFKYKDGNSSERIYKFYNRE